MSLKGFKMPKELDELLKNRCLSQHQYVQQTLIWLNAKAFSSNQNNNLTHLPRELKQVILFDMRPNWMPYQMAYNMLEKMDASIQQKSDLNQKCFPLLLNNNHKIG